MNKPSEEYCYVPERYKKYNHKILRKFRDLCIEHLMKNPDGIRLPNKLGDLKVLGYRPETALKDYGTSNKYDKDIYHDNAHTDGYVFKIIWHYKYVQGLKRKTGGFRNGRFYSFKPSKPLKRALVNTIFSGNWKNFGTVTTREDFKP